jgi:hypothetical protein
LKRFVICLKCDKYKTLFLLVLTGDCPMFFRVIFLCPDCGELHDLPVAGEDVGQALKNFMVLVQPLSPNFDQPFQCPLMVVVREPAPEIGVYVRKGSFHCAI